MKLNIDCVRDVLLAVEEYCAFKASYIKEADALRFQCISLSQQELFAKLPQHYAEDIAYSVLILHEAGYIAVNISQFNNIINHFTVYRLTYAGHEFLDVIRPADRFRKIKQCALSIGAECLGTFMKLGTGLLGDAVSGLLNNS